MIDSSHIFFDGVRYITADDAATRGHISKDYVTKLAREGKIVGRQIERRWYISEDSLLQFLTAHRISEERRRQALAAQRRREYGLVPEGGGVVKKPGFVASAEAAFSRRATVVGAAHRYAAGSAAHIPMYALTPGVELLHKVVASLVALVLTVGVLTAMNSMHIQASVLAERRSTSQTAAVSDSSIGNIFDQARTLVVAIFSGFPFSAASDAIAGRGTVELTVSALASPSKPQPSLLATALSPDHVAVSTSTSAYSGGASRTIVQQIVEHQPVVVSGGISESELDQKLQQLSNKISAQMYAVSVIGPSFSGPVYSTPATSQTVALSNAVDHLTNTKIDSPTITGGSISGASISATGLSVSGNTSLATTTITGDLSVTGTLGVQNISLSSTTVTINGTANQTANFLDIKNASGTTVFAVQPDGTLISNTSSTTQSVSSLLVTGNATATNMVILSTASTSNLLWTNATGTNAVITNATTTNLFTTGFTSYTAPIAPYFIATSSSATSTFAGGFTVGTSQLTVQQATGFVGIGTSSPQTNLEVDGSGSSNLLLRDNAQGSDLKSYLVQNSGANLYIGRISDAFGSYAPYLTFLNGGNVGVGTTNPWTKFAVAGGFAATASSTIGSGTQAGGLTVNGGATTTGNALIAGALTVNGASQFTNASSTNLSNFGTAYFGGTATSSFSSSGVLTLANPTNNTLLYANGTNQVASASVGSSLTFSAGTLSLNTANPNTFTGLQQFANSTSTLFSATQHAYFGTSGQSYFDFNGVLTLGTSLAQGSGGTGLSTYAAGDILYANGAGTLTKLPIGVTGNVLTVQAGLPAWGTAASNSSSGVIGAWATTTNNLALYPSTTAWTVVVGASATSTINSIFEVHGQSYFSSLTGIATTSPATTLSVGGSGYLTGGLGVGVLNTTAGSLQTSGNATVGGILLLPTVTANSLLYNNGFNQVAAASVNSSLTFSGGALSLNTGNANTFSALQTFGAGLAAYASSTIGNGTQAGGLTVSGGATTTGNTFLGGNLAVAGSTSLTGLLSTTNASTSLLSVFNAAYFGGTATSSFGSDGSLNVASAFTAFASSTIGNGTQTGGLTVSGGATTTGDAYFGGNIVLNTGHLVHSGDLTTYLSFGTNSIFGYTGNSAVLWMTPTELSFGRYGNSPDVFLGSTANIGEPAATIKSNTGNFGIGTTSPQAKLEVTDSSAASTTPLILSNYGSATSSTKVSLLFKTDDITHNTGTSTASIFSIYQGGTGGVPQTGNGDLAFATLKSGSLTEWARLTSAGNFGIGTTSAAHKLSIWGTGSSGFFGISNSTSGDIVQVLGNGNVGVGTTTPYTPLSISKTAASPQFSIGYDTAHDFEGRVDSTGGYNVHASGNNIYQVNDNLWVCTGGSITTNACPTGTPTGQGNLIVANKVGIGTSTPVDALEVNGRLKIYPNALAGTSGGIYGEFSTDGGNIILNSAGVANSGSFGLIFNGMNAGVQNSSQLVLTSGGKVGVGTSTPTQMLSVQGLLQVGANNNAPVTLGTATSTFNGDIKILGKLDVSTIDPVYTIDGTKYATYGESSVGIHEEMMQTLDVTHKDPATGKYVYAIDFDTLEKGSDLWLFYQITDFGESWKNLVVQLTPAFDGTAFYEKVPGKHMLLVEADQPGEVSMRLTGSRYDFTKWQNLRPDQDGNTAGTHVISSKAPLAPIGNATSEMPAAQTAAVSKSF